MNVAPFPAFALGEHAPAVLLGDRSHDVEAEARALDFLQAARLEAVEAVEDALELRPSECRRRDPARAPTPCRAPAPRPPPRPARRRRSISPRCRAGWQIAVRRSSTSPSTTSGAVAAAIERDRLFGEVMAPARGVDAFPRQRGQVDRRAMHEPRAGRPRRLQHLFDGVLQPIGVRSITRRTPAAARRRRRATAASRDTGESTRSASSARA